MNIYAYCLAKGKAAQGINFPMGPLQLPVHEVAWRSYTLYYAEVPHASWHGELAREMGKGPSLKHPAIAHESVINAVFQCCSVMPFRFPTLFADLPAAFAFCQQHEQEIDALFAQISDCCEMGIKLYGDIAQLSVPPIAELPHELAAAEKPGTAFLREKLRKIREEESRSRFLADKAAEIMQQFSGLTRAADYHILPHRGVLLEIFLLVPKPQVSAYTEALQKLAIGLPNIRHHHSGPWPSYHFSAIRLAASRKKG